MCSSDLKPTDEAADITVGSAGTSIAGMLCEGRFALYLAGEDAEPEQLSSAELIYGRELSASTRMTLTGFYNKAEILGINFATLHTQPVGEFKYGGLELELNYQLEAVSLGFSHAYTKLDDFDLAEGGSTRITASHLGYGNDLNNWSNHMTKFNVSRSTYVVWRR